MPLKTLVMIIAAVLAATAATLWFISSVIGLDLADPRALLIALAVAVLVRLGVRRQS